MQTAQTQCTRSAHQHSHTPTHAPHHTQHTQHTQHTHTPTTYSHHRHHQHVQKKSISLCQKVCDWHTSARSGSSRLGVVPGASSAAAAAAATCAGEQGRVDGGYHPPSKLRPSHGSKELGRLEGWVMTSVRSPRTPTMPSHS